MKIANYSPDSYTLVRPISFIVKVKDVELTATIVEIVDNPIENEFVIKFSDGYKDSFVMTESGGNIVASNWQSGKNYAVALKEDMEMLALLSNDELVWNLRYPIDGELTNVWIRRRKRDEGTIYAVYYRSFCYFHVTKEEGQWISKPPSTIDPFPINQNIVMEVIKLLEREHLIIPFNII